MAAHAFHTLSWPLQEQGRADPRESGCPNGGSGKRLSLPVTYLFFRDGWGAQADQDDGNGSEDKEDEGKVEVVHVLQHRWPPVLLPTGRGTVTKLQDHPNHADNKASHEAPESTLRKGKHREKVTANYLWL